MKIKVFSPLSLAILLLVGAQFGFYLYTPALPDIAAYFHVDASLIQMTLSIFILTYGLSQFLSGIFSDFLQLRVLIIFYSLAYLVASIFCYASPNYWIFMIMRSLEGFAAGGISTLARVTIKSSYDDNQLLKNMSTYSMASVFAPAISPFIGGQLVYFFKWQDIFLLLSVYVFFLNLILICSFPRKSYRAQAIKERISLRSILKNIASVIKNREFIKFSASNILIYFACVLELTFAPFIIINQYKLSTAAYGIVMIFPAMGYFFGNYLLKRLGRFVKIENLINTGLSIIFVSGMILWTCTLYDKPLVMLIVICLTLTTIGAGFILSPLAVKAYSIDYQRNVQGTSIAIYGSLQMLGASLLLSLVSAIAIAPINVFILVYVFVPLSVFILMWNRQSMIIEESNVQQVDELN